MLEEFIRYLQYEKNYSPHTVMSYRIDLKQFERFYEELTSRKGIEYAERNDIRHWIVSLANEDKTVNPTTIGRKLSSLRSFYKFLIKRNVITETPMKNIIPPKRLKPLPAFMTEKEMDKYAESKANQPIIDVYNDDDFDEIRDSLIIEVLYQTGIRRSELINIKHQDIDFARRTIKITGKRRKVRLVPFGEELEKQIRHYIKKKKEYITEEEDFLFVLKKGKKLYDKAVYNVVVKQLEPFTTNEKHSPHTLRHTFATALLNQGADLNVVKELMGHSSLASTQVYTHTTFKELQSMYKDAHPRAN